MSKYHAIRTNGYASKKEAKRAQELKLLEIAGQIENLVEQVPYELIPKQIREDGKAERAVVYKADFEYDELTFTNDTVRRKFIVEDVKGMKTPEYVIKRKLMLLIHGITIKET